MSAAAKDDTVWIGFMDIVPVIGAVREAVELVLALYEGKKAVIKEKEKAVENLVKESLKKHVNKLTVSDKPAAAADEFSGLRNVRVFVSAAPLPGKPLYLPPQQRPLQVCGNTAVCRQT
ncbi:hypothetical protein G5714_020162 [Onychostoma macrolepis]|uniref:Uncharacterized protein n=1 Tax=Onychostoma macrolepis TaxID=369639 RepID=A0A7J6BWV8_9TELE|nr:hypothetical protein G5714_020162 [Onychostoma macrolepis]